SVTVSVGFFTTSGVTLVIPLNDAAIAMITTNATPPIPRH
ncbi:hypothetical protein SCCGRSA3_02339, partial [Marine Group I thaumarchaeote SCGC RSA3]